MTARWRFASTIARLTVGGPIRAVAIGSALLVLTVRFLGWGIPRRGLCRCGGGFCVVCGEDAV